ncbi:hypothetical protein GCM10027592_15960 [Spirosoma flavus]
MAVELSEAKGSLKETAQELGPTAQILTQWHRERAVAHGAGTISRIQSSQEQQEIVRLKKEIKQVELDRIAEATRYSKKADGTFPRGDGKYSDL